MEAPYFFLFDNATEMGTTIVLLQYLSCRIVYYTKSS